MININHNSHIMPVCILILLNFPFVLFFFNSVRIYSRKIIWSFKLWEYYICYRYNLFFNYFSSYKIVFVKFYCFDKLQMFTYFFVVLIVFIFKKHVFYVENLKNYGNKKSMHVSENSSSSTQKLLSNTS